MTRKKPRNTSNGAGFRPFVIAPISIYKSYPLKGVTISIYSGRKDAAADPLRGVVALAILRVAKPIEGEAIKISNGSNRKKRRATPRG